MRRLICSVMVLTMSFAVPALCEEKASESSKEAVEILKKLDEASKKVQAVKYDVVFEATKDAEKFVPQGKGTIWLKEWRDGSPKQFYVDVEAKNPGDEQVTHVTAGSDGENYYIIDHEKKIAYEDIDPAVMGSGRRLAFAGLIAEFVHPEPFSDEINAKSQTLKGEEKIGDELCYVVYVEYGNVQRKSTWYISKKDFLPRCRVDHFEIPETGTGDVRKSVMKVDVDPKLTDADFKLKLPEGYAKTDEFAD